MSILCFSVFQGLLAVLMYAILFYPYFACLTTKHKLIGSLMGFLYTTIRYEAVMIIIRASGRVRKLEKRACGQFCKMVQEILHKRGNRAEKV